MSPMHLTLQCTLEKNQAESDTSLIQLLRDMIRDGKTKAIYLWIPLHALCSDVKYHDDCNRGDHGGENGGDDDDDGFGSKSSGSNMTSGDAGTRCVAPIIL